MGLSEYMDAIWQLEQTLGALDDAIENAHQMPGQLRGEVVRKLRFANSAMNSLVGLLWDLQGPPALEEDEEPPQEQTFEATEEERFDFIGPHLPSGWYERLAARQWLSDRDANEWAYR